MLCPSAAPLGVTLANQIQTSWMCYNYILHKTLKELPQVCMKCTAIDECLMINIVLNSIHTYICTYLFIFTVTLEEHCSLRDAQVSTVSAMVGHYGKQIIIENHNITITIPKGAIEKGVVVEIAAAASCFASFNLSKDYRCISCYLWIGANYDFQKPLKVEMEHHAAISRQENLSKLCVMEGKRNTTSDYTYDYTMCEVNDKTYQFHVDSSRCTFFTKSGYTCLASKDRKVADKVAVYYFLPKSYKLDNTFAAVFCLCYTLKFCKQVNTH